MKPTFNDEQRARVDAISHEIWDFLKSLEPDQVKVYNTADTDNVVKEVAEPMGMGKFLQKMRDSELRGYYNPKKSRFVIDPLDGTMCSYEDPFELFAILRRFY